jgi:hypothetical protein
MSHRSFGGLHQLASTMWYDGRMVSVNAGTPTALTYMQKVFGQFHGRPDLHRSTALGSLEELRIEGFSF